MFIQIGDSWYNSDHIVSISKATHQTGASINIACVSSMTHNIPYRYHNAEADQAIEAIITKLNGEDKNV